MSVIAAIVDKKAFESVKKAGGENAGQFVA